MNKHERAVELIQDEVSAVRGVNRLVRGEVEDGAI